VSCFDDNDTDFVSSDDLMPSSQQGGELASIHGDRVKPEVAAPGCGINSTTTASPWISVWGGSSFAAPMVLGMHALLTEADPNMTWWPEVVKAITIATATHEVVESPSGALIKPQSGTGGISIGNAISGARGIHGGWAADYINCSPPYDTTWVVPLQAGDVVRAAIVWDSATADPNYLNYPSADIDLHVYDANGGGVMSSAAYDRTFELVKFTAPSTGTYRFEAYKFRCNTSPEGLAFAYFIE
jgi:hypothetical protein